MKKIFYTMAGDYPGVFMKKKDVQHLLEDIMEKTDLCFLCEKYNQTLNKCKCLRNSECAEHILNLFEGYENMTESDYKPVDDGYSKDQEKPAADQELDAENYSIEGEEFYGCLGDDNDF